MATTLVLIWQREIGFLLSMLVYTRTNIHFYISVSSYLCSASSCRIAASKRKAQSRKTSVVPRLPTYCAPQHCHGNELTASVERWPEPSRGFWKHKKNQIFYHTHCITPKRVTSLWGPFLCHCACGNKPPFEEMSQQWRIAMGKLCPIWPAQDLMFRSPPPETNVFPIDQPAGTKNCKNRYIKYPLTCRFTSKRATHLRSSSQRQCPWTAELLIKRSFRSEKFLHDLFLKNFDRSEDQFHKIWAFYDLPLLRYNRLDFP